MTKKLEERCNYAGNIQHTHKLPDNELILLYARLTMQDNFCGKCKGYDTKCPYYFIE